MVRPSIVRAVLTSLAALAAGAAVSRAGDPPQIVDLGRPTDFCAVARGVNNSGQIVGEAYQIVDQETGQKVARGLLWKRGPSGDYGWTEIPRLDTFPNSYPRAINDAGRIAGWAEAASLERGSPAQVVMWDLEESTGTYAVTDLGTLFGFYASETASSADGGHILNQLGQIVGSATTTPSWETSARLWAEPETSPPLLLPVDPGLPPSAAYGVNEEGSVAGRVRGPMGESFVELPILWTRDSAGDFAAQVLPGVPAGTRANAWDVNARGDVVGVVGSRAALWARAEAGAYEAPRLLDVPAGSTLSRALAINDDGVVVGWAVTGGARHAIVWRDEGTGLAPTDLGTLPGHTSSDAYGINDRGLVVGSSWYFDAALQATVAHAVLWEIGSADVTPPVIAGAVADPSTLWPPNGKVVTVSVAYEATDEGGAVTCDLGPVAANERITADDWAVVDPHHVRLRAERSGAGTGRLYTIPITCTDPSGNSTRAETVVQVPHDRGKR
jgi:probable HAF family extracellular repeat protein